jgi:hypothetical protein
LTWVFPAGRNCFTLRPAPLGSGRDEEQRYRPGEPEAAHPWQGGKIRFAELPAGLAEQLNTSKELLFTPSQSWKSAFCQAVRNAARDLGIKVSGLHRLRSNCAQNDHQEWMEKDGQGDRAARMAVSQKLGHNRIDVVGSYIPATE